MSFLVFIYLLACIYLIILTLFLIFNCRFMKEYCPDSCEDFTATTFKCEDDPEIDCQSVKEHGMCNYLAKDEKSM